MEESVKKVLLSLQAQCVKREYCSADIRRKALERLDGDRDAAEEVLQSLKDDKFVSDARYASAFAREKSSLQGWGAIKIRFMLRSKGIAEADIAEGLSEIDSLKASERLERLLENKWKTLQDDPQGKFKLIKFALGRGYDYPEIESVVKRITAS